MVERPPTPLYALEYNALFDKFNSDALDFETVFPIQLKSVAVVEFRHALTTTRNGALDPKAHSNNPEFIMERYVEIFDSQRVIASIVVGRNIDQH